jgi:hypothetical protein
MTLIAIVSFKETAAQKTVAKKPVSKKVTPQKIKDTVKAVVETPLADTAIIYHEGGTYTLYISELEKGTIYFTDFTGDNNSIMEVTVTSHKGGVKKYLKLCRKGMGIGLYSLYNKAVKIDDINLRLTEAPKLLFHTSD